MRYAQVDCLRIQILSFFFLFNCYFGKEVKRKGKDKTKATNYSRRKNVSVASFLKRSQMLSGGEI
jgi:hypothetical protein